MQRYSKNLELGTFAAIACLLLDQIHKFVMLEIFHFDQLKEKIEITNFFNLVMVWNRGISFGLFQGMEYSNYFFMGLSSIIILVIFFLIKNAKSSNEAFSFGMIIGGATGNLVDRVRLDAVADFFDFYYNGYHYPAFNIADSCVFLGAALLIINTFFHGDNKNKTAVTEKVKKIKKNKKGKKDETQIDAI